MIAKQPVNEGNMSKDDRTSECIGREKVDAEAEKYPETRSGSLPGHFTSMK